MIFEELFNGDKPPIADSWKQAAHNPTAEPLSIETDETPSGIASIPLEKTIETETWIEILAPGPPSHYTPVRKESAPLLSDDFIKQVIAGQFQTPDTAPATQKCSYKCEMCAASKCAQCSATDKCGNCVAGGHGKKAAKLIKECRTTDELNALDGMMLKAAGVGV